MAVAAGSDEDAVLVVNQLETDETMARRLQEEMDREFALSLAQTNSPQHPVPHRDGCVRSGPVSSGNLSHRLAPLTILYFTLTCLRRGPVYSGHLSH